MRLLLVNIIRTIIGGITILMTQQVYAQNVHFDSMLGEKNARMIEEVMGHYPDEEKTEYLRKIGRRLVAELEDPLFKYQFHMVPDPAPNAFALPGGYLYVTTGLIPILETEDELACILAHEIIHSNRRHSIKQMRKGILPRLLELPGNLVGLIFKNLGTLINTPIKWGTSLIYASYGRSAEKEADEMGIQLAAKAGYDPGAMVSALTRLSLTMESFSGIEEKKSYFNDHPYTPDRNKLIKKTMKKMEWETTDPVAANFLMEFDSTLFGANPGTGVIRGSKFLHPDLGFAVEFPNDWIIDNQPKIIGAYEQDGKAASFVSIEEPILSPRQAANKFYNEMGAKCRSKITESKTQEINGNPAYLVSFTEETKRVTVYAQIIWIKMDDKLFKLMGLGVMEYKSLLSETAKSLRTITKSERSGLEIKYLRVVEAKNGETIKTLSDRAENTLPENLTTVINDRAKKDTLDEGEQVKIVLPYPYRSKD